MIYLAYKYFCFILFIQFTLFGCKQQPIMFRCTVTQIHFVNKSIKLTIKRVWIISQLMSLIDFKARKTPSTKGTMTKNDIKKNQRYSTYKATYTPVLLGRRITVPQLKPCVLLLLNFMKFNRCFWSHLFINHQ